jgi:hypothetical protein
MPVFESYRRSVGREIRGFCGSRTFVSIFYRSPPLGPTQSRINQVHMASPNPWKIELNFILPSAQVHKCFFSPSGHFAVPFCSTRHAHLILFPFITFMLCRRVRFTTPVTKATGFSQTWRSRIKSRQVILILILINNQLNANFFYIYSYFDSPHVSSKSVLIIRRVNCINTTSGVCHSGSSFPTCTPDGHLHKVT